jgi:translocation and assembly module TamB
VRARRAIVWLGWTLLSTFAVAGLALAALAVLAAAPLTRPLVASRVVALLEESIAGRVELGGIEVLARGGIELRGLEVFDPDGHLVLSAGRARAFVDLTGLRARSVGITLELDAPSLLLEEEEGGVSLLRAFAPSRPRTEGARDRERGGPGWTLHVSRLAIRGGEVWWVDTAGETRLEATGVDIEGRGLYGPGRARVDVRARGVLAAPLEAPFSLELTGRMSEGELRVPLLRAEVGGTAVWAAGEGDLVARTGRVAVTRLGIVREAARALVPATPGGDDLAAWGYVESDGAVVTAAVRAVPAGDEAARDVVAAAAAARLSGPRAVGFDVSLERLDPARLAAGAPAGDLTLVARGAVSGRSRADLRGRLAAKVERSRLRGGEIVAGEVVASAERGTIELSRVRASIPGGSVEGAVRWREGGPVAGRVVADARDLGAFLANLGALLAQDLPRLGGRARVAATLGGTSAAPSIAATVDAPALRAGGASFAGVHLSADAAGPLRAVSGRVEGRIAGVRGGDGEIARAVTLRGTLADGAGTLSAGASLPGFRDPASLEVHGRLGPERRTLDVTDVSFAYPGSRWSLVGPARVTLAGPSVDRLELASGAQRVALAGGLGPRGALDAKAELVAVDLAALPAGLLPEDGVRGELSADVRATGSSARPDVTVSFSLVRGAHRALREVTAAGSGRWSGTARRASASVALSRGGGGAADLDLDVPYPLAGRPAERVRVVLRTRELPLGEVLATVQAGAPLAGRVTADAALEGTAGAPRLRVSAAITEGAYRDLDGIALDLAAENAGERLRLGARAALEGRDVVALDLELPLDLAAALAHPREVLRGLPRVPVEATLAVTGLELASISGRAGVPEGLAGSVVADAAVEGSLSAPRGTATVEVARGGWAGYGEVGARIELSLGAASVATRGVLTPAGGETVRLDASLGVPPERLWSGQEWLAAPLRAEVATERLSLARAAGQGQVPLSGTIAGRLSLGGSLRAPEATLALGGRGIGVEGRPLGDVHLEASHARARTSAEVQLRPTAGGALRAVLELDADLGVGAPERSLGEAEAAVRVVAEGVDLGFLPALAPGVIRSAAGTLEMDVEARVPLAGLPRGWRPSRAAGTLRVAGGRLAVAELGEWTDIGIEVAASEDAIELSRIEVRRGRGLLTGSGALRGLRSGRARLDARLDAEAFKITRAGMDLATIDLRAEATGTYADDALAVDVTIPRGVVRLPRRSPRALQSLERREDIVVERRSEERRRADAARAVAAAEDPGREQPPPRPFTFTANVTVPRNLFVRSDDPRIDLELRADVRYERSGGEGRARGTIEAIRGTVEPIAGRNFVVERGRVQLGDEPHSEAILDIQARYENPAAVVTVFVQGPARSHKIVFASKPAMDDAKIAMLIATGRTELRAGAAGVGTLTGEEAGRAALAAIVTQAFKDLVADKLPIPVILDDRGLHVPLYKTDRIYVGYARRLGADPERGENPDEVRIEYQLDRNWTFESRYGNASGGASLIRSSEW